MKIITVPLWPHDPNVARMDVYLPDSRDASLRPCVLVCPGGGYGGLAPHEGDPFASLFVAHNLMSAVLYYRVAPHRFPAPQADACRAMRLLRARSAEFRIDPARVGILGFSAGGHLAATTSAQPDLHREPHDDLGERFSARPDRTILAYPVISFTQFVHTGSAINLLGDPPDPTLCDQLSNEKHVTRDHPPTFLFHTADDPAVPVENALAYAAACRQAGVPVELHVYQSGRHGVGMALDLPAVRGWTRLLLDWLADW